MRAKLSWDSSLGPYTAGHKGLVYTASPEKAVEMPGCFSFFPSLQEDILEELLSDMALAPFPGGGPSSLPVVPEETPPFLLSPSVDIPAPCPNLQPPENPLRRLLVPEEGERRL